MKVWFDAHFDAASEYAHMVHMLHKLADSNKTLKEFLYIYTARKFVVLLNFIINYKLLISS